MLPELLALIISYLDDGMDIYKIMKKIPAVKTAIIKYGMNDHFNFTQTNVTDDILKYMAKYFKIKKIYLGYTNITDIGLKALRKMNLHTIDISVCNHITYDGLRYVKGVYDINLAWTPNITDEGLRHLKGVKVINLINLSGNDNITYIGMRYLKGVHTIDISNTTISGTGLRYLGGVHTIHLSECCKNIYLRHISGATKIYINKDNINQNCLKYLNTEELTNSGFEHYFETEYIIGLRPINNSKI